MVLLCNTHCSYFVFSIFYCHVFVSSTVLLMSCSVSNSVVVWQSVSQWVWVVMFDTVDSFMGRMSEYINSSESNTIFTDDLKSAMCLAETDDDIDVMLQMLRRWIVTCASFFFDLCPVYTADNVSALANYCWWTLLQTVTDIQRLSPLRVGAGA